MSRNVATAYGDFVKVTDVKNIVQDMTLPLLQAMKARETEAIRTANCINLIFKDIKDMKLTTR